MCPYMAQAKPQSNDERKRKNVSMEGGIFVQTLSGYVIVCVIVIRFASAYELARTTFPNIIQYIN